MFSFESLAPNNISANDPTTVVASAALLINHCGRKKHPYETGHA